MDSFSRSTMCRRVPSVCYYSWILYVLVVVVSDAHATEVRPLQQQQQHRRAVQLTADPRIVGGTPAALGAYPFYVLQLSPRYTGYRRPVPLLFRCRIGTLCRNKQPSLSKFGPTTYLDK